MSLESRGSDRPKKRWLDTVKEDSVEMEINILEATICAKDR